MFYIISSLFQELYRSMISLKVRTTFEMSSGIKYPRSIRIFCWFILFGLLSTCFLPQTVQAAVIFQNTTSAELANPIQEMLATGLTPNQVQQDTLLIGIQSNMKLDEIKRQIEGHGFILERAWPKLGMARVRIARSQNTVQASGMAALSILEQHRQTIEQTPFVRYATYDARVQTADITGLTTDQSPANMPELNPQAPDDPRFEEQWALSKIGVLDAWTISRGGADMAIAVIDSGYDVTHSDIHEHSFWTNQAELNGLPNIDDDNNGFVDDVHGWDWVEGDGITNDPLGHGTHVGGIIAATTNNGTGITGMGGNLKIMPLRILDRNGGGYISDLVDAIDYALDKGVRILNLSLILQYDSPALGDAIEKAHAEGAIILAAAGNFRTNVYWPAAYPETVAVAATDSDDYRSSFSNYGPEITIAAPGTAILSTYAGGSYHTNSGTSMATPHVAALAGLVWSLRPDLSRDEVIELLKTTADDVNSRDAPGTDPYLGAGRINVYEALQTASKGLKLELANESERLAFIQEPSTYSVRVSAVGTNNHVASGAVVQYAVLSSESDTDAAAASQFYSTGTAIADSNGTIQIGLSGFERAGTYIVRTRVGDIVTDLPLEVYPKPALLTLSLNTTSLSAGQSTRAQVEVRDSAGALIANDMPFSLKTSAGHFGSDGSSIETILHNGVYTTQFNASTGVGMATIEARVGDLLITQERIEITPGAAAQLEGHATFPKLHVTDSADNTPIIFTIYDAFGNLVTESMPIELSSNMGQLSSTELNSINGKSTAILSVEAGQFGRVTIQATVPGTNLHTQVVLPVLSEQVWLPMVIADYP